MNKIWSTIKPSADLAYLGPREILEGRALAISLRYLFDIAADDDLGLEIAAAYVDAFYRNEPRYTTAIETVAGIE